MLWVTVCSNAATLVMAMYILRQQGIIRRQVETIRRVAESTHDHTVPEALTSAWERKNGLR